MGEATGTPRLPKPIRRHLDALTGELGILHVAKGASPDPAGGYRIDDVARALEVDLLHAAVLGWPAVAGSAALSLRFLEDAYDATTGKFRDARDGDGSWSTATPTPESFGRAMLGLAHAIALAPDAAIVERANVLFDKALPKAVRVTALRGQASMVLACAIAGGPTRTGPMRTLATDLHARFRSFAQPGWPWPESELTSENALLPRALIVTGHRLGAATMLAVGLQVLDWLIGIQTSPAGQLSPVGTGTFPHGGAKAQFDQLPLEATALLLASEAALAATGRPRYRETMERSYAWFLGANDLGLRVADPSGGAAHDALTADGLAPDKGAEATLLWLIAVEHIRDLRKADADRAEDVIRAAAEPAAPAPAKIRARTSRSLGR